MKLRKPIMGCTAFAALGMLAVACAVDPGADEEEPAGVSDSAEALSSFSCNEHEATAYINGNPSTINVVTVDGHAVRKITANAYYEMAKAAQKDGVQIRIVSGFRTMAEQKYLYHCYTSCSCNGCNLAAKPGYSNHQSGHALDLNTSAGGVYSFLANHGAAYRFHRTVPSEAWHWEHW
jgi:LAS superfamily LD-carboxypeptidase LdcB